MSEYGIKIKNIVVGSLLEKNAGVREQLDSTDAMLCNSLFLDYMKKHGLTVYNPGTNKEYTRDIVVLDFKYGSKSYEQEKAHLNKLIKETEKDERLTSEEKEVKLKRLNELLEHAEQNKDKYVRYNRAEARDKVYTEGIDVTYDNSHGRKKKHPDLETIHYKRLFRTPGKAKKGTVDFIREELYDVAKEYLYMGIDLDEYENPLLVEAEAYSSLATSTIVGKIKCDPHDILILKDYDSFCYKDIISVEKGEDGHVHAVHRKNAKIGNSMFDGQGLIDHTFVHQEYPKINGFVLLRNHFCKMACFDTDIQGFFRDWAAEHGIDYDTWQLEDMFGNKHYAKDIKIICHESAVKWTKFVNDRINYDYWCKRVIEDNDSFFGVVKTAKKSKLGDVQKMSYQHVNCMSEEGMEGIIQCTKDYIYKLKYDDDTFLAYLNKNKNFSNDYEVLVALVKHNADFVKSSYFKERRDFIITSYVKKARTGRIINEGDNMTIMGSPYAELLWSIGENPENDPTFENELSAIQCYSERFKDGEFLCEMRSPFNARSNMGYLHNHLDYRIKKYFYLGENCIAVNTVHTDFQPRNNGSDNDGDTIYVTNQLQIVEQAKYCVQNFPTIDNRLPKDTTHYKNTSLDLSLIDNRLMSSQMGIGLTSNLAQVALSYSYTYPEQKYKDYVSILSVLAQVYIDSSKRSYDIDLAEETKRIQRDLNIKVNGYPEFLKPIHKYNNRRMGISSIKTVPKERYNPVLHCPMNYLYNAELNKPSNTKTQTIPMSMFFIKHSFPVKDWRRNRKVEKIIEQYGIKLIQYYKKEADESLDAYFLLRTDFDALIEDIKQIHFGKRYVGLMSYLINRAFVITPGVQQNINNTNSKTKNNRPILIKTLYELAPEQFLCCFTKKN